MMPPRDRFFADPTAGVDETCAAETRSDADLSTIRLGPQLTTGTLVNGRYRVEQLLGTGGMGSVYRVSDNLFPDRAVALKTIREDVLTQDRLDLFKAEFRIMTAFRHPNVAAVYDFEPIHATGGYLFTMEFIDGRDVLSATDGADLETVLDLMVGICRALAYVHSRGVIHFDLKPSNLLVSTLGRIKVLDFGVATPAHQAGIRRFGTPAYMAPELFTGAIPDYRADLYSLGIVMYQLLARRLPFETESDADLAPMSVLRSMRFDWPSVRTLPPWIRPIIERLCAHEPADRFRSANAVIEAVNRTGGRAYELETPQTRESYILSTRFIGREAELKRVVDFVMDRTRGSDACPPVMLVSGLSGVGKSRLIREARHHAQLSGLAFIEADCYEGSSSEYGPVADMVTQLVRLAHGVGAVAVADQAPLELAGSPSSAQQPSRQIEGGADRHRLRLREETTDFLVKLAHAVPYVLCVNDLQWAQPGTIDLLAHLARALSVARASGSRVGVAVLGTFRDDEIRDRPCQSFLVKLQEWHASEIVALTPLARADVGVLVSSMLGASAPDAFVDRLARETTGIPFFVEEIMRSLVESGSVYVEGGAWIATQDVLNLPIPSTVVNVLRRRINSLEPAAHVVLTLLAAYGRPAPARPLTIAAGLESTTFGDALKRLLQRQMAVRLTGDPVMYTASHDQIRELVYGDLSPQERQSMHGRIAEAIETAWSTELDDHVFELAHHYWLAGARPQALAFSLRGAERAWSTFANHLAIELFQRVLELLPDDGSVRRLDIVEKLGDLYALHGRFDEALIRYRQRMGAPGDQHDRARLLRKTATVYWQRGELVTAVDWLWQAAEALGDSRPVSRPARGVAPIAAVFKHLSHRFRPRRPVRVEAERVRLFELAATYSQLGEVYFFHDSSQMLLPILRASNAGEQAGGDSTELARAYSAVMVVYGTLTLWGSAGLYARRLTEMAARLGLPWHIGFAHTYQLILHYYRSEWREGIDQGRQGWTLLHRCGDVMELSFAGWVTALCYYHCGKLQEGAAWARAALETMQRIGSDQATKGVLAVSGRINARLGHLAEAREQIERSVALASEARDLMFLCWTQMMMGDCLLIAGQIDQAVAWLENARRIREDNGLLPEYLVEIYSLLAFARLEQIASEAHLHDWQRRRRLKTIAALARKAMRLSRRRRHHHVPALRAAAVCAWRSGARRRAVKLFERSAQLAEEIGSPLQRAETLEAWGRCLLDAGDGARARDLLTPARTIYERAGAAPLVSRVQVLLGAAPQR
jgi:tetratricopeptide (TPR) repeat protein/predicted Ser/Thr protein kinase